MAISRMCFAALTAIALSAGAAGASVVGSTISCSVIGADAIPFNCIPASGNPFTITPDAPNPDVRVQTSDFNGRPVNRLFVDFMGGWVDITGSGATTAFGPDVQLRFSGFVDDTSPSAALRVSSLSIQGVSPRLSGGPGLTPEDFMISGNTLTIDLGDTVWDATSAVGFDVAVPLPASVLLLAAGLAGLGFVGRHKGA